MANGGEDFRLPKIKQVKTAETNLGQNVAR
jgi:hypothetical protein